ncbi:MAG: M1 family metallopeptidase, partial [Acidimicrobiaceae bacterium]|nr:M1 family metallopeptidase [Acidimicrobiaceae bacterium]
MPPRTRPIIVAVALVAAACSSTAVDETPDAAPATSVAVTTTTQGSAPTTTEPAATPAPTTTEPAPTSAPTTTAAPEEPEPDTTPAPVPEELPSPTTTLPPTEAEGLGNSFYPFLGNGGYDVLHYEIDLDVDTEMNAISAVTSITAQATEDLETFNLDLLGLEVHSVAVDGAHAEFDRYGHELAVHPASPVSASSQFEVEIVYSGSPEPLDDPGVPFARMGWLHREGVIYTASEPSGAMTWFPSNNHPTDKATFEIRITVPDGLVAASNGLLTSEKTSGGRTTFEWRMDDPMATYLAAVYIGDFKRIDHGPLYEGGPLLRDYVPSDSPPEVAEALAVTPGVFAFLEELLGPYPFDAYGTIVMPFQLGFALENQT